MELKIVLNVDNAAFREDDTTTACKDVIFVGLERAAFRSPEFVQPLFDANGNECGSLRFTEQQEPVPSQAFHSDNTFLLTKRQRGHATAILVEGYEKAKEAARYWVGEHNAVDGCSTVPVEFEGTAKSQSLPTPNGVVPARRFTVRRNTSFGARSAVVEPINFLHSADVE